MGTYSDGRSASCAQCAAGQYDDDRRPNTPCQECPSGRTSTPGQTTCAVTASNQAPPPRDFGADPLEFVAPSVTVTSTQDGMTTYRLAVTLRCACNVYSMFGMDGATMSFPPAFQVAAPFGADLMGVSPAFFAFSPQAAIDSWLTVGITEGGSGEISSVGMGLEAWSDRMGLEVDNGAVFWMDPTAAPAQTFPPITLAQLTVPSGITKTATVNLAGKPIRGDEEWYAYGVRFVLAAGGGGGSGGGGH